MRRSPANTGLREAVAAKDDQLADRARQIEMPGRQVAELTDRVAQLERRLGRNCVFTNYRTTSQFRSLPSHGGGR